MEKSNVRGGASKLLPYIVSVSVRRTSGNHLADESGQEKHCSEKNCQQGNVEQRLVRNRAEMHAAGLVYELGGNQPNGNDEACKEHQYAGEPEEMHGLLSESAQEPEGEQVQKAVHETLDAEFALAIFALLVMYRLLGNTGESGILGQIRYVAMHLAIDFDILHDLVAIGLQATVHIVEFDSGNPPGRSIVEF